MSSEQTKIAKFINLLTDKTLTYAVWSQAQEHTTSYECKDVGDQLLSLKQGSHSTALVTCTQRNILEGFNQDILTELACRDDQALLESLINLS